LETTRRPPHRRTMPPVAEIVWRSGVEHDRRMSLDKMRAHLARAESELEAAQRFLDPRTAEDAEMALVRAVANARTSVADALETIRSMTGES
jgi:hypothetical protein